MTELRLATHGRTLATRELAARLRSELEADLVAGLDAVLDFTEVRAVSYSFADELIGPLAEEALKSGAEIRVTHASDDVLRVIERASSRRGGDAALKVAAGV